MTPLVGLGVSAIAIISHIAHLEGELQKSKEFLNSVINAIPDPIFVKDKDYRWVVLNEAYCQFLGHSQAELLEKNESDVLPPHQATEFKSQDDLAFATSSEQESEGELTNAHGHTYAVAMKRTFHQDSAGNLFLVGVIHDITHRKRMEEELSDEPLPSLFNLMLSFVKLGIIGVKSPITIHSQDYQIANYFRKSLFRLWNGQKEPIKLWRYCF